jgi:hypothetical protein
LKTFFTARGPKWHSHTHVHWADGLHYYDPSVGRFSLLNPPHYYGVHHGPKMTTVAHLKFPLRMSSSDKNWCHEAMGREQT